MAEEQDPIISLLTAAVTDVMLEQHIITQASARQEKRFLDILTALKALGETSVDTQKRLAALEEHTGLKPAS